MMDAIMLMAEALFNKMSEQTDPTMLRYMSISFSALIMFYVRLVSKHLKAITTKMESIENSVKDINDEVTRLDERQKVHLKLMDDDHGRPL